MKGFADKCLLLFPKPEAYEYKDEVYYNHFKKAVNNLIKYLKSINVEIHCFTTDEIALTVNPEGVRWIQTLPNADSFFMQTHNEAMAKVKFKTDLIKLDEGIYTQAMTKFPVKGKLNIDQRFEVVIKRERLITKELINKYSLVFTIHQPSNQAYTVPVKKADGKLRVFIKNGQFSAQCFMSGELIDSSEIFNFPGSFLPMHEWEV